ncbi:MAG TPA: cytochrome c biogenesis protein DipZ [Gaiellaceae bacterium]|nr:cytochrome c biogenesis protein DipZ [Gaiellaceae bacterium]
MLVVAIPLAFVAGLITAVSPCVLPVLPIIFGGGIGENRRRPFAIIAGLATCFLVSILLAVWVLDQLGLPQDLLRDVSIGMLFLLAATLLVPRVGEIVERPLARLSRRPSGDLGGGFVLGCALGFVFVPCGGPAIGFVTSHASTGNFTFKTVAIALAYTLGASLVLLAVALGGQRVTRRIRAGVARFRLAFGVALTVVAVGFIFNFDQRLQTWLPGWTDLIQKNTESSGAGLHAFRTHKNVTDRTPLVVHKPTLSGLKDYGAAPNFTGIETWLNTPGGKPLTLAGLHGKVVLVDFWTYSCINCLRTLPYLKAWYRTYAKDGFVIVGVHTPEFAFEHEVSNVRMAIKQYGVHYPVAIDNGYGTWNAYGNQYWPAEYLIDANGHVRDAKFGEGNYSKTENAIRSLLAERDASLPKALHLADHTPDYAATPESYLGTDRLDRYEGSPIKAGKLAKYTLPFVLDQSNLAYGGYWNVGPQRVVAGKDAVLALHFLARRVHLVLGGTGYVDVYLNGKFSKRVHVTQDRLYTLVDQGTDKDGRIDLHFTPGVSAYAFTFG